MHASTRPKKSSPRPGRWSSYQAKASAMSCSASGATINLAAITAANPSLDLFPSKPRARILQQIRFPSGELLFLPIVDRHRVGRSRKIIPEVFNELQLLRWAQVENGGHFCTHTDRSRRLHLGSLVIIADSAVKGTRAVRATANLVVDSAVTGIVDWIGNINPA